MAIHHLEAQVAMPRDSGLPEDVSINTFHWQWNDASTFGTYDAVGDEIRDRLGTFYSAVDNLLSARNANPLHMKMYDFADAPPRVVRYEDDLTALVFGTGALPSECAVVVSFGGAPVSGTPQARRRGRIFLGPMTDDIMAAGVGDVIVSSGAVDQIASAAFVLASDSGGGLEWCVYSRTDDALVVVTNGFVDDAFDTMRSRGADASYRNSWVLV